MNTVELFGNLYELSEVIIFIVLLVLSIVLLITFIYLLFKLHWYRKYLNEIKKDVLIIDQLDEEDELDDEEINESNEVNDSIIGLNNEDEIKKITCPRRLNLKIRLNNSSDQLKKRYSKIRNFLEQYKVRERFLKHRDQYFIRKEFIERNSDGSVLNKSSAYKIAMLTIRRKQLILSLNVDVNLTEEEASNNIVIETRRYNGYNYNMKLSTEKNVNEAISLLTRILENNNVSLKKKHVDVDYTQMFNEPLTTFERRGFGYLLRENITFEESDNYVDSLAKKAIVVNKLDEKPLDNITYEISLDDISKSFNDGDLINLNVLKEKGIVSDNYTKLVITDGTYLDKKLYIDADGYSTNAIKMIFLTGGEARILQRIKA